MQGMGEQGTGETGGCARAQLAACAVLSPQELSGRSLLKIYDVFSCSWRLDRSDPQGWAGYRA